MHQCTSSDQFHIEGQLVVRWTFFMIMIFMTVTIMFSKNLIHSKKFSPPIIHPKYFKNRGPRSVPSTKCPSTNWVTRSVPHTNCPSTKCPSRSVPSTKWAPRSGLPRSGQGPCIVYSKMKNNEVFSLSHEMKNFDFYYKL